MGQKLQIQIENPALNRWKEMTSLSHIALMNFLKTKVGECWTRMERMLHNVEENGFILLTILGADYFVSLLLACKSTLSGLQIRLSGATLWARARGIALAVAFISARTGWGKSN